MSISHFIYSAICIGITNIFIEWLFIGFLFHKYQALTPQTWKPESSKSYAYSSVLSILFGILFTLFYFKIGFQYVIPGNLFSASKYGLLCFGCFTVLPEIAGYIYVNLDRGFIVGKLLSGLFTYLAAGIIASLFY